MHEDQNMDSHKKNILVVEDNVVAAKVIKIFFESLGCLVDHVPLQATTILKITYQIG